jgi:hypothetical protein
MQEKGTEISLKCEFVRLLFNARDSEFKVIQVRVVDLYTSCPREVQKNARITCVGECPDDYIKMKTSLRIEGMWINTRYGNS